MMIERRTIFEIHRLANEGLSVRKIAATLGLSRLSVQKYLDDPSPQLPTLTRASKLDPFQDDIKQMLEVDPKASAMVIRQRLGHSALRAGF
jgi:predicted transcriptional regulator